MARFLRSLLAAFLLVAAVGLVPAAAAPKFPPLTGRVVDQAKILSPATESALSEKLAALEDSTGRQLVVATLPSLQGYEIEEFGYQLGRAWGIGRAGRNDGVLFLVAPNERKVRIEVGYGLEPILTDALSSVILQSAVIPHFKTSDMEGGVIAGAEAIADQLALPPEEAQAVVAKAQQRHENSSRNGIVGLIPFIIFVIIMMSLFGGRRRRRGGLGAALPWIILGSLSSGRHNGGGWSGGGGGFSGGGGSFGGGGSSGGW